jgi:hypothetical protein
LFARRFERHAICDCTGLSTTVEFVGRAMSALAEETRGGADSVALERMRLHATEADAATWTRALLEAWKVRQERSLLILENADAIAGHDGILALLGDMLAAQPIERALLISSRVELPLEVSRYLAPHQVLTLARSELALDTEEALGMFEGTDLAAEIVERIVRLADGWPSALMLLARVAHYEANVEGLLDRLDAVTFADLHHHLLNDVLAALTPEMMSTMIAAAAIPRASLEDISAATGIRHASGILDGLLRLPGFISSEAGTYQMHPLLLEVLRTLHEPDFANYLLRAAHETERAGDFLRAAELYDSYGESTAAADALERLPAAVLEQPSVRLIDALAKIPMSTLRSHPNLWIAILRFRRRNVDGEQLYAEVLGLLQTLSPEGSPPLYRRLSVRRAMLAQELGRLSEARATLGAAFAGGAPDETPEERRLVLMASAVVAAKQGRFAEADRFVETADAVHGARHVRFDVERGQIAMEKARFHGDWQDWLKIGEEALVAAQRTGPTAYIVEAARAVALAAWYCDDDQRWASAQQLLRDCGDADAFALASLSDAALTGAEQGASQRVMPLACWHAALASGDADHAKALFDRAIAGIDALESDFLRIAIRVCAALLLPAERRRLLEARTAAQRIESPPLQASVELLIDSPEPTDYGIFKNLAARVGRSPLKVRRDVLFIDVARAQVRRGSNVLHVSDRGFELLVALALLPAGTSKESLASSIWPTLDAKSALNALKMCVSRTRAQVADKEAILSTRNGYTLSERAVIDVREYERLVRSLRGAATLGESIRRQALDAVAILGAHRRAYAADWPWFAPHAEHLDELHHELRRLVTREPLELVVH